MRKRFLALGLMLLAGSSALLGAPKKDAPAELNLVDMDGKKVHLKDYRGKVVVVNFWATWCGPCREEMPMYVAVVKEWAAKGIVFIAASIDEKSSQKNIPGFLKQYGIDFPVWKGATGDDLFRLGMGDPPPVPDTAFIDEEGNIVFRVQGEIKKPELLERLEWLSGDRKGPAPKALLHNL
jgi:thiol-disulfide isomerase/thioredoxin